MVRKEPCLCLLVGQDSLSKNAKLNQIKQAFLPKQTEQFNLDVLYGRGLKLTDLQERILSLPVKSTKRLVVIKQAEQLQQGIKDFILKFSRRAPAGVLVVLDMERFDRRDSFLLSLSRLALPGAGQAIIYRFKESFSPDTFTLSHQIDLKRTDYALKVLNQLLRDGEKPEIIMGGLRYAWTKGALSNLEIKRRLKLLLDCDLEIKTGKLKALFALEKLIIGLSGLKKPLAKA